MELKDTLINIGQITSGKAGEVVKVPVYVSDLSTLNVLAYELGVKCDETLATIDNVDSVGTLTEGFMGAFNNHVKPYSSAFVLGVGANAYPVKTGSVLLNFVVTLKVDVTSPVLFMPFYYMLNETLVLGSKPLPVW